MSLHRVGLGILCLVMVVTASSARDEKPTAEDIARAVKQLGDDDFETREKASRLLWSAGAAAEPALRAAIKNGDAEVVLRAKDILEKFRWGIYPDTPAEIVDLVNAYRGAADDAKRDEAVRGLLAKGSKGLGAVRKMVAAETEPMARDALTRTITQQAATAAPALLSEGKYDALEDLLEFSAATREPLALQNYVACLSMRGRLDAKIAELKAQADDPGTALALAYLYRAKGDFVTAVKHSRTAKNDALLNTLLYQTHDWTALQDRVTANHPTDEAGLGLLLTCQIRTGNKTGIAESMAALRRLAENKTQGDGTIWWSAKPLFVNDLTAEGLEILPRGDHHSMMIDILVAQGRFREALALCDKVRANPGKYRLAMEVRRAKIFGELGESKKVQEIIAELLKPQTTTPERWEIKEFLDLLYEFSHKEEAFAKMTEMVASDETRARDDWMWSAVFPKDRGSQAEVWWHHLQQTSPETKPSDRMKAIRDLLDGKVTDKALAEAVEKARSWAATLKPNEPEGCLNSLADFCKELKRPDLERECLLDATKVAGTPSAWQRLGEHDAAAKKWTLAAESFRKASEKDNTNPAFLWLWGLALTESGDAKEGARLQERARWLPLGDDAKRYLLAHAMKQHGHKTEGRRELELNRRLSLLPSWYFGHANDSLAEDAEERKDYAVAADAAELSLLMMVNSGYAYLDDKAWVIQPAVLHSLRGRGYLAAGKPDDAMKEAAVGLRLLPGDVDVPILYLPGLEKLGRKKEADELFEKVYAFYAGLLRDYPDWARGRNDLAWLCARCRRKSDEAVKHAERAVALDPERVSYLDTLAEAHFQNGAKAKAVELMKKCLEREPTSSFYKKQLVRYEAGDPKADVPEQRN
jgi:tetratricopeptide (TPR) repeat protein